MTIEEERFMKAKSKMTRAISDFYKACKGIDIDDAGFVDDIADQVMAATEEDHEYEGVIITDFL